MSQLSSKLRSFLLRNQDQYKNRKFLINALTRVLNRPSLLLHPTHIVRVAASDQPIEISLDHSLSSVVYPDLKLTDETAKDVSVIDLWMAKNNLPLMHDPKDVITLIREMQNYYQLTEDERAKVDAASSEFRGIPESEYISYLLQTRFKDVNTMELVHVVDDKSNKPYFAELRISIDKLLERKIEICILSDHIDERLMSEVDTLTVSGSDIVNVRESQITTTVGRVIVNGVFLVDVFGDMIPFANEVIFKIDDSHLLTDVRDAIIAKKATEEQYTKFMDAVYYIGHFSEICTPCMNEKSLVTDPAIAKRKAELYKEYADRLNDPVVMAKIEDELIAMDKEWLKGDTSMRFYKPLGGKAFDLWRKKLYIAVGGIEAFDKDTSKYDFVPNSLEEGMTLRDLPKYGNESRKGSYQRGHETRNGGALTKYIIRAFHDSRIVEEDCGTRRGVTVNFAEQKIEKYLGRFIMLNGKWTEITNENISSIKPGKYLMRSPQYCQCTKNGYCFQCMGRMFAEMDVRQLTMNVVDISTTFMNSAMKNMHGSKLSLFEITSLDSLVL